MKLNQMAVGRLHASLRSGKLRHRHVPAAGLIRRLVLMSSFQPMSSERLL